MTTQEKLNKMLECAYNELSVVFNSDGNVLSKKELKPFAQRIVLNKINFAIQVCQDKEIEYNDLTEIKNLIF